MAQLSKNKLTVYDLIGIDNGLRELSKREKLDAELAWDLLQNIQAIEHIKKSYEQYQKDRFQKFSVTKNGQTGIDPSRYNEYEAEIDLVGNKEEEVKLAFIPFDALKDKDGKVHADILVSISKIVKK